MSEKFPQPEIGETESEQALNNLINKQGANFATQEEADEAKKLNEEATLEDGLARNGYLIDTSGDPIKIPKEKERLSVDPSLN